MSAGQWDEKLLAAGDAQKLLRAQLTPEEQAVVSRHVDNLKLSYLYLSSDEAHLQRSLAWNEEAQKFIAERDDQHKLSHAADVVPVETMTAREVLDAIGYDDPNVDPESYVSATSGGLGGSYPQPLVESVDNQCKFPGCTAARRWNISSHDLCYKHYSQLHRYGLTVDLVIEYGMSPEACAICFTQPAEGLVIDHDHAHRHPGRQGGCRLCVRDFLCAKCNREVSIVERMTTGVAGLPVGQLNAITEYLDTWRKANINRVRSHRIPSL